MWKGAWRCVWRTHFWLCMLWRSTSFVPWSVEIAMTMKTSPPPEDDFLVPWNGVAPHFRTLLCCFKNWNLVLGAHLYLSFTSQHLYLLIYFSSNVVLGYCDNGYCDKKIIATISGQLSGRVWFTEKTAAYHDTITTATLARQCHDIREALLMQ